MLCRVDLVRTDVSEGRIASIIWVTIMGELRTTLALTSNRRALRRITYKPMTFSAELTQVRSTKLRWILESGDGVVWNGLL
jgi:malonyl CoA-acyl carrier protein transacylase